MLNDIFLNNCFYLCMNKYSTVEKSPRFYSDILDIIERWEEMYKKDLDVIQYIGRKITFLKLYLKKVMEGKSKESALSSFNWEAWSEFKDMIQVIIDTDLSEQRFTEISEEIDRVRGKFLIFKNRPQIEKMLSNIDNNSYETVDAMTGDYETVLLELYKNYCEYKTNQLLTKGGSFSVVDGKENNMDCVLENYIRTFDPENKIPTGFQVLDDYILNGGMNKRAVYVFAGAAKSGKSTIISNLFINSLKKKTENYKIYVYITLENRLDQAFPRLFCPLLDITQKQLTEEVKSKGIKTVNQSVVNILKTFPNGSKYDFKPSKTLSVSDIYSYLEHVKQEFGYPIGALYLDYLYHLKPSSKNDLRLQLGELIQELTTLSIHFDIPVVTATQLNREHVKVKNPYELTTKLVGESHLITCHADSLFLMAKDLKKENIVHFNSGTQRNGRGDIPMIFKVDFDKFKFESLEVFDEEKNNLDSSVTDERLKFVDNKNNLFNGFGIGY